MSETREAEIRDFTRRALPRPVQHRVLVAYSRAAARWERARLRALDDPTPATDAELTALAPVMVKLVSALGLTAATVAEGGAVPGVTAPGGWLIGDPARLLDRDWQTTVRLDALHEGNTLWPSTSPRPHCAGCARR